MNNLRTHGTPPYSVALLHGGPGVAGEMAPVAMELSSKGGILEPLQTASSIDGQVAELKRTLEEHGQSPMILVGYSWGAWLGLLFSSRYPGLVRKLILVGSGPFEEKYTDQIHQRRFNRLNRDEQKELKSLMGKMENPAAFERVGEILAQTDYYDPIPMRVEGVELRADIFNSVWKEASEIRKNGKLLEAGKRIPFPVVAIHGDHDPHPAEGVQKPLSMVLKDFRFILLEKCGHSPWMEKQARDEFFRVLNKELSIS